MNIRHVRTSGLIRLKVEGQCLEVTRQNADSRRKFSAALRQHSSEHVRESDAEHIDLLDMFDSNNRVPDVDRYRVCQTAAGCRLVRHPTCLIEPEHNAFRDVLTDPGDFAETVVVVLESPHAEEYVGGDVNCPIAPAQGITGCNIRRLLAHVLSADAIAEAGLQVANNSRVVIANPVQFQASLWCIHSGSLEVEGKKLDWRTLRNAVWRALWDHLKETDFAARLSAYNPSLILNCCTKGLQAGSLSLALS